MLQTKEYIINGKALKLSQMTTLDYMSFIKFSSTAKTTEERLYLLALGAYYALKINLKELKAYQFIRRHKVDNLIKPKSLMKYLSVPQLSEISDMVAQLEGFEIDKKKAAEESQYHGQSVTD